MNLKFINKFLVISILFINLSCQKENNKTINNEDLMVRIAEIEIAPEFLNDYLTILKEEANASVKLEPGVISIFPMYIKDNPTSIRLIEIYASTEAYESHLQTPHFKHYKTSTLHMVKSLKLVEMEAIDKETMMQVFKKL